jgi:hypothetical protein
MHFIRALFAIAFVAIWSSEACAGADNSVPALARMVSELPQDTSIVDVPEGVYMIGSTWVISKPGITVRGAGIGKTILIRDPSFSGVLVRVDAEGSTLSNLTLDGNRTATVLSLNGTDVTADSVEVKNFTHIGIAAPASVCRITKCLTEGLKDLAALTMGIWHDAGPRTTDATILIDHNTIKDNSVNGIYCTGGKVTITNNRLTGNHSVPNIGGGQIDVGNAFTTNTVAVITGNTITDGGSIKAGGIELGGGTFTVAHNVIRNHGAGGIGLGHNTVRATVSNNTISNCGRNVGEKNVPQCRSGIYVMYGASNVLISGNRCFDDQPNKTQTYGIILTPPPRRADPRFAAKATEHVVIRENDLRGNIHPEGLLDESRARDKSISANLPSQANR